METAVKHKRNHVFCIIGLIPSALRIRIQILAPLLPLIASKCGIGRCDGSVTNTRLGYLELFCQNPDFESLVRIFKEVYEELRASRIFGILNQCLEAPVSITLMYIKNVWLKFQIGNRSYSSSI